MPQKVLLGCVYLLVGFNLYVSVSHYTSLNHFLYIDAKTQTTHGKKMYERDYKSSVYDYTQYSSTTKPLFSVYEGIPSIYEKKIHIYDITYLYIYDANSKNNIDKYMNRIERPLKVW